MPRRSASSAQTKPMIDVVGQDINSVEFVRRVMGPGMLAEKAAALGMSRNTFDAERKRRADQIALQTRIELDENVHKAMATLVSLLDCDDPNARYKAAKDILDRAGFKPTDRVEVTAEVKRTPKEIEAEVRQRLGDEFGARLLGLQPKDLEPTEEAPGTKHQPDIEDGEWQSIAAKK